MSGSQTEVEQFTWLINKFVEDVPGATHAVVVSSDGLLLSASEGLSGERAEQLSAMASGLLSLAQGVSRLFEQGEYEQTIIRMQYGFLFITTIADGCCFTVLAHEKSDMKVIAYQMALLVEKAAHVLTPKLRSQLREAVEH